MAGAQTPAPIKEESFASREAHRLLKSIADKKANAQRIEADRHFKENSAADLWTATKSALRQMVQEINSLLPNQILQWEVDRSDNARIKLLLTQESIFVITFDERIFAMGYRIEGRGENNAMTICVESKDGERVLMWESGDVEKLNLLTAQKAAETLISYLTAKA